MAKETKAYDRQKGENSKNFERFLIYLKIPKSQRTIVKATQLINEKECEKSNENNEISPSAIENISSRWNWKERADLYDTEQLLEKLKEKDDKFNSIDEKVLNTVEQGLLFLNDLLERIISHEGYALTTLMSLMSTWVNTYEKMYQLLRLCCGRPNHVTQEMFDGALKVESEDTGFIVQMNDKELEELLTINDDFEDFTDQL